MFKHSKLSPYKIKKILKCFSMDLTALQSADFLGLNRNTINRFYKLFREKISKYCATQGVLVGEIELDESYFGGKFKGKRGRGSENKIPVFGVLKRNSKVYTEIIPDAKSKTLRSIINKKVHPLSVVYTDAYKAYDGLILDGFEHYRINHSAEFARGKNHINGIESFWSFCKRRLTKFNGLRAQDYYLHIKECEFRFNHRNEDIYDILVKVVKKF